METGIPDDDASVTILTRAAMSGVSAAGGVAVPYKTRSDPLPQFGYEGEAAPLPHPWISRLPPREWRRRLIHMSPGLWPPILWLIPHPDPLPWYSLAVISAVVVGMSVCALRHARLFERPDETGWATSVISFGVITLTLLLAFPSRPEIGLAVTVIIAFGDGAATLGGLLVQGPRLPWNAEKSWAGLATFLLVSVPTASIVYWGEARPDITLIAALACVGPAASAAAVAETLPVRVNDNIRVGLTAALVIVLTQSSVVG